MASLFDMVYAKSPVWLQQIGISAYGLMWKQRRYGGAFKQLLMEFEARQRYGAKDWEDYQTGRLRELLLHASRNVPYYTRLFHHQHMEEVALESFTLKDLAQLPVLEKHSIRYQPEDFISATANRKHLHSYLTSGTSGTPL